MRLLLPKHFGYLLFFLLLSTFGSLLASLPENDIFPTNGNHNTEVLDCIANINASSTTVCEGSGQTITITGNLLPTGTQGPTTTWQWYRNDQPIPGNNSNILQVTEEAGTYYVIATSPNCDNSPVRSNSITIRVVTPPNNFTIATDPDAGEFCAGTPINFSVFGAEADVQYRWRFGDGTTANGPAPAPKTYEATGGGAVPYTVTVDAIRQGCIITRTLPITILPSPELNFEEENDFQICLPDTVDLADTTVTAVITNTTTDGISHYFIDWGDGSPEQQYVSSPDLFPLTGPEYTELDNYTIRIRGVGNNGCETVAEYVFNYNQDPEAGFELAKPAPAPAPQPEDCLPIIIAMKDTSSGGGLTYLWEIEPATGFTVMPNTGYTQDTLALNFTVAGNYNIRLIVENGCGTDTTEQSVLVGWPQVQLPADTTICGPGERINYSAANTMFDANFGEINPNTIVWTVRGLSNGHQATYREQYPNIVFPLAGQYSVTVFAENNCGDTDDIGNPPSQRVTVLPIPGAATVSPIDPVCSGATTIIRPTGPGPGYNFYESEFDAAPFATGQTFTTPALTQSRSYYVRAVNELGCEGPGVVVSITVIPPIENNEIYVDNPEVCATTGSTLIRGQQPAGGTGNFTYQWEISTSGPTTGFSSAPVPNTNQDYTASALNQRVWFRRVAISGNCPDISEPIEIIIRTAPAAPVAPRNVLVCTDSSATISVPPVAGNTYEWFGVPTGGTPIATGASFTVSGLTQNTTYYVQAVGANGCPSPRSPVTVSIVTATANAGPDVTIIQGKLAELRASGGATYSWEPAAGLNNPNVRNPIASPAETTTYTVTVTTAEGCQATDEVTVTVVPALVIPNAFSPNRDGVNEVWEIENFENYPDIRVEIFNRWGNLIFRSEGYATPWDGTYRGQDLPVATYYYMIYLTSSDRPISGNVTIIR